MMKTKPKTLETTLHTYSYDLRNEDEREAYNTLAARLNVENGRCFEVWDDKKSKDPTPGKTTLELESIFNNQWNTPTHRVFNWFQAARHSGVMRVYGHYLDITADMREVIARTHTCGWCGQQYWDSANGDDAPTVPVYCTACVGGAYLTEDKLHMLEVLPVNTIKDKRALSAGDLAELTTLWEAEQISATNERDNKRQAQRRKDIEKRYTSSLAQAEERHTVELWLLNHGIQDDNVIFYTHTDTWCFGWRTPLGVEEYKLLLKRLGSEMPFNYEIKRTEECRLNA